MVSHVSLMQIAQAGEWLSLVPKKAITLYFNIVLERLEGEIAMPR